MGLNLSGLASAINAVHSALRGLLNFLGLLVGIFPKSGKLPRTTYVTIHYVLIGIVIVVLAVYSNVLVRESEVRSQIAFVQRFYVAIMFIVAYLIVRVAIVVYFVLMTRDISEFEDINQAFEAGLEELAREGFDLQWLPVFLINGATSEQLKSILESCKIAWKVNCSCDDPRFSVLSFHASDEALFISLNDVGALSRQLKKVAVRGGPMNKPNSNPAVQPTMSPDAIRAAMQESGRGDPTPNAAGRTLPPGGMAALMGATIPPGGVKMGGTLPPSGAQVGSTMLPGMAARAAASAQASTPPANRSAGAAPSGLEKLNKEELRFQRRRLDYFCQLLATERGSYCPLNGLLQVIPLRWTQSRSDTYVELMESIKSDLQGMHDGFQMQFPVVCMHAGLEELNGLAEFVERGNEINTRFKESRAGSHFPGGLVIDEKSSSWVVERGLIWFRDWVYAEFAKNLTHPKNRQLYQFLCSLALRRDRLARELLLVMGDLNLPHPVRLKGCYFSATGKDGARQAFVHDLILRLMSEQNDVAYRPDYVARDSRYRIFSVVLFFFTMIVCLTDLWLAWQLFNGLLRH